MPDSTVSLHDLDHLRRFVMETLSGRENLLAEQFPLHESKLLRGGRECGRQYFLYGPRSVRLNAIWDAERDTIYFYDAAGERFGKVQVALKSRPSSV